MEGNGGTRDRRPTAPNGSETVDREPRDDGDSDQVDDAEQHDAATARQQQRPANGENVERDDEGSMVELDAVGEVIRAQLHANGTAEHRREQDARNDHAQRDKRGHRRSAMPKWFVPHDRDGHEDRQDDERDQQVCPDGGSLKFMGHVPLEPQPDERLDDLMHAQQQRQCCKRDVPLATVRVANGIDPDRADDNPTDEVSLRREAHLKTGRTELVSCSWSCRVFRDRRPAHPYLLSNANRLVGWQYRGCYRFGRPTSGSEQL